MRKHPFRGGHQTFCFFVFVFSLPSQQHAEGKFIAEKLGCRFVETSAKLGSNVTETFIDLVCEIRDRNRVSCSLRSCLFSFSLSFFLRLSCCPSLSFIIWDRSSNLTPTFCFLFYFLIISPSRPYRDYLFLSQEMLEMRRVLRPITPDSGVQLPGAGCWNKGCTLS